MADPRATVLHGDCLDVLRSLPDCSVDAVVTDPPYGLADHQPHNIEAALRAWLTGDREHVPTGKGFMGRDWDAFVPPPAVWDECLRVLKPGGHLLAFSAPRTSDLMTMSIRLAGFEIRDSVDWIMGSGFPKSLDVSKQLDRMAGAEREVLGHESRHINRPKRDTWDKSAAQREGFGLPGAAQGGGVFPVTEPATDEARRWSGWGTALKPAHECITVARKPLQGNVAGNVLVWGTGAINIDACRVATTDDRSRPPGRTAEAAVFSASLNGSTMHLRGAVSVSHEAGRWPPNVIFSHSPSCNGVCAPGCPVAELDQQSGNSVSKRSHRGDGIGQGYHGSDAPWNTERGFDDSGGASRFFPVFRYQAKAPASERPRVMAEGGDAGVGHVAHPT